MGLEFPFPDTDLGSHFVVDNCQTAAIACLNSSLSFAVTHPQVHVLSINVVHAAPRLGPDVAHSLVETLASFIGILS